MYQVKVKAKGFETKTITIPDIENVSLSAYIDFVTHVSKIKESSDEEPTPPGQALAHIIEAVSLFTGEDMEFFMQLPQGKTTDGYSDKFVSAWGLYNLIAQTIGKYRPKIRYGEDLNFEYKGEQCRIPGFLISGPNLASHDLPTAQAIEVLETQRLIQDAIKLNGDPDGAAIYTQYLRVCAILVRTDEHDRLPYSQPEIDKYIDERVEFFKQVPMVIALDVDFFDQYYASLKKIGHNGWFFNPPSAKPSGIGDAAKEAEYIRAQEKKARQAFNRIGFREIVHQMKDSYFIDPSRPAIESISDLPFNQTVRYLSQKNSMVQV